MARRSGILFLDKPQGVTSAKAVAKLKRVFPGSKIGHGGTLDPMASGMLPILIGGATKLSMMFLGSNKVYLAGIKLGITTDTLDAEGTVTSTCEVSSQCFDRVPAVIQRFVGRISQTPPIYSALKYRGKPMHYWARRGVPVQTRPREVEIYDINLKKIDREKNIVWMEIYCSSGTYIRTFADDFGSRIGCGGSLCYLRRLSVKGVESMVTLDEVNASHLIHLEDMFSYLERCNLNDKEFLSLKNGSYSLTDSCILYYQNQFKGILMKYNDKIIRYLEL